MRIDTKQILVLFFVATLLVLITSCSARKNKGIAERAVEHFHDQFNAERYHDIYTQADKEFRKTIVGWNEGEKEALAWFDTVHRKLGTVKTANETKWNVDTNVTRGGKVVNLSYNTQFSEGNAQEHFMFFVHGDDARLATYSIDSPLLTTK